MKNLYQRYLAYMYIMILSCGMGSICAEDYYQYGISDNDVEMMVQNSDAQFVYVPSNVGAVITRVLQEKCCEELRALSADLERGSHVAYYTDMIKAVPLAIEGTKVSEESDLLSQYSDALISGDALLSVDDELVRGCKCRVFCNLTVSGTLTAGTVTTSNLIVGGVNVTSFLTTPVVPQHAYIYNASAQTVVVEGDVTFDTNGLMTSGFTHTAGTAAVTVVNAGTYLLSFSISSETINQFALFANGVLIPGSIYAGLPAGGTGNGRISVQLAAGTVITVRNHTSAGAIPLTVNGGGTLASVNASIFLSKLA